MQVDFYQLGSDPLASVLASIATRVLAGGDRLLMVSGNEAQLRKIDEDLWTLSVDSFLPHGRSGADQPILLGASYEAENGARNVALIDGVWRDEVYGFDRTFYFFDGGSIDVARGAWRTVKAREDAEPRYWRQDEDGRWRQIA